MMDAKAPKPGKPRTSPLKSNLSKLEKQQVKALDDLMKKRAAEAARTGSYPNYYTN